MLGFHSRSTYCTRLLQRSWHRRLVHKPQNHVPKQPFNPSSTTVDFQSSRLASSGVATDQLIYFRKPHWLFKWGWCFVVAELVWCGSVAEMIFNHWTQRNPDTSQGAPAFIPRPLYQRVLLATGSLVVGGLIAASFYAARNRVVRRIFLRRNGSSHWAIIETAGNKTNVFSKKKCELSKGRDATELAMHVQGVRGAFWIALEGAVVPPFRSQDMLSNEEAFDQSSSGIWMTRRNFAEHWAGEQLPGRWMNTTQVQPRIKSKNRPMKN